MTVKSNVSQQNKKKDWTFNSVLEIVGAEWLSELKNQIPSFLIIGLIYFMLNGEITNALLKEWSIIISNHLTLFLQTFVKSASVIIIIISISLIFFYLFFLFIRRELTVNDKKGGLKWLKYIRRSYKLIKKKQLIFNL